MSLLVLKKGWLCTVQDMGRPGYAQYGINRSGAMDLVALQVGNFLVGNPADTAALEICFPAPGFLFLEPALICLAGANFGATIDGKPILPNQPVLVTEGTNLQFQHKHWGQFVYLCIHGGLELNPWLNSYSTQLRVALGGWAGRNLQTGDVLPFKFRRPAQLVPKTETARYFANLSFFYPETSTIRFIPGQYYATLSVENQRGFLTQAWSISNASDRMGYRLAGKSLTLDQSPSILSAGLSRGSIQLPPGGAPIVLMADHQTTGGYPILGQVIQADWSKLAQMGAGQQIIFEPITLALANTLLRKELQQLNLIRWAGKWALKPFDQG